MTWGWFGVAASLCLMAASAVLGLEAPVSVQAYRWALGLSAVLYGLAGLVAWWLW